MVDDDPGVLRSLGRLLASVGYEVTLYQSAFEVLDVGLELTSGCILVDLCMPGIDGFELQARLKEMGSGLPVIVLTGQADVSTAVQAMKTGAVDFLEKPVDPEQLLAAVDDALSDTRRTSASQKVIEAARHIGTLTPREQDVLSALALGRSNKVIAGDLGISVRTVEVHRARMLERLGVRTSAEAIRLAVLASLRSPN